MNPIILFFILSYLLSWIIWLPLYGYIFGITNLPTLPFHHALGGFGPLLSSFLTTWIYSKKKGLKELIKNIFKFQPTIYLLIAIFSPLILVIIALIINYFITGEKIHLSNLFTSNEFPHFNLFTLFIYNLIFFGYGEEVGWRGFALPRLQSRLNAFTSSIILTLFWALWHWPLFFYRTGYTTMNFASALGWIFSLLTGSILLTWLYNSSRGSILICAVFHSTIDIIFTANFSNKNIVGYMGFLITVWGIVTILIFKPKNLAINERKTNKE